MEAFATLQDMCDLWRPIKPDEQVRVENLLVVVSDLLRAKAKNVGKDLMRWLKVTVLWSMWPSLSLLTSLHVI